MGLSNGVQISRKRDGVLLEGALIEYLLGAMEAPSTETNDLIQPRKWSFAGISATFKKLSTLMLVACHQTAGTCCEFCPISNNVNNAS